MAYGRSITFEPLRSLTAVGPNITTAFQVLSITIGPTTFTTFTHPIRGLSVVNGTNQLIIISYDGVTDHDVLPAGSGRVWDFTANSNIQTDAPFFPIGNGVYARYPAGGTQPTTGSVYAIAFYCLGD